MEYFEFVNSVKILCGENAIDNISFELNYYHSKKPIILSDKGLEKLKVPNIVIKALQQKDYLLYTDIPVDSSIEKINEIVKLYNQNKCDSIIAVGGGSVIDTAKGVRLALSQNTTNISKLAGNEIVKNGVLIPFIVIPTTSGTGSECTAVAVIKDDKTHIKQEYISQSLLPNVAILDSIFTQSLPAKLTASTAIDALTHAIEAYTSLQKNPISDVYAITSIKLIANNLIKVLKNNNKQARINLALASCLAGIAFSNAMVGIVHAIGHAVGGYKNIPHGNAMAILLPHCMKFNLDKCKKEYEEILLHFVGESKYVLISKENRANQLIVEVEKLLHLLNKKYGLPLSLKDYGVNENDLLEIANRALNDGAVIVNKKRVFKDDIINILRNAL